MASTAPTQYNVIAALPKLRWRHLEAPPYDVLGFEWGHRLPVNVVPYVDGDMHDGTGRESYGLKARLYFCNGIEGRADLFPKLWNEQWLPALLDSSSDELNHPIVGPIRARLKHVGGELVAKVRSGIIVDVQWVETVEDPEEPTLLFTNELDVGALAQAADDAIESLDIPYPDGTFSTSFLDAINSIKGELFSVSLSVGGALARVVNTVNSLIDTVTALNDPSSWMALSTLRSLFYSLRELGRRIAAITARATASRTLTEDTTLDAFAVSVGNKLQDVMGLNLSALRTPIVPKGTTLLYYTNK